VVSPFVRKYYDGYSGTQEREIGQSLSPSSYFTPEFALARTCVFRLFYSNKVPNSFARHGVTTKLEREIGPISFFLARTRVFRLFQSMYSPKLLCVASCNTKLLVRENFLLEAVVTMCCKCPLKTRVHHISRSNRGPPCRYVPHDPQGPGRFQTGQSFNRSESTILRQCDFCLSFGFGAFGLSFGPSNVTTVSPEYPSWPRTWSSV
jgi:hypothetical protein